MLSPQAIILLQRLSEIANVGAIPAKGHGSTAVGMTLLDAMGIEYTSVGKPMFMGIVVTARRELRTAHRNRVNLFARVPNWQKSACKSSAQIAEKFGYDAGPGIRKLYCTVSSRHPNSQGLYLRVDERNDSLEEVAKTPSGDLGVANWSLDDLRQRLAKTHPESMWVSATVTRHNGTEYFHYRKASYTGPPMIARLATLLAEGTITVDHLIQTVHGETKEKGPLFKIIPSNLPMLFPAPQIFDLLTVDFSKI